MCVRVTCARVYARGCNTGRGEGVRGGEGKINMFDNMGRAVSYFAIIFLRNGNTTIFVHNFQESSFGG